MGLPPREPVPEPASPIARPGFPRSRRDSDASGARYSERSLGNRRTGTDTDAYDDHRRSRTSRQYDPDSRQDGRRIIESHRRTEPLSPSRTRTNSTRRPALPKFDNDRDRPELVDLDEEDDEFGQERRSDRGGAALANRRRRQLSDPYRQSDPDDDFSTAEYDQRPPRRSVSNGHIRDDYRRKPGVGRSTRPSSYDTPEARRNDFDRSSERNLGRSASKSWSSPGRGGGMLNRVLSRASGGSRDRSSAPRLQPPSSRLNRYSNRPASHRRDDDEMELARIEEDEMLLAIRKRRSAANLAARGYDESDPRWYRDDRDLHRPRGGAQPVSLESTENTVRRSMDRERQRTLDALERSDSHLPMVSRTDAVVRSRSQFRPPPHSQSQSRPKENNPTRSTSTPQKSSREAALAAITGVSTGALAANAIKKRHRKLSAAAEVDEQSDSQTSSEDEALLHDAVEPADVHDDEAVPIIVTKSAKPLQAGKATPDPVSPIAAKKLPESTSDDDDDSDQNDSDDESTEQTSEGFETTAKPAPAISQAAIASTAAPASRSTSKLLASSGNGRTAPKGYLNLTHKAPSATMTAAPLTTKATARSRPEPSEDSSEDDDEEDEDQDHVDATPKRSRATPAVAIAALTGGAAAVSADAQQRRAAKLQAEQQHKAAQAEARAAKADRAAEKRRAKQEASAAAAAAALAAKEAKRNEKIKKREAKQAEAERKRDQESQARDRAIREKEEAEEHRLLAAREHEHERDRKSKARQASRRQPHGAGGPKKRSGGVESLTPQQRHYLLKALVMLQMQSEWSELEKFGALTEYGYPFSTQRSKLTRIKTFERGEEAGDYAGAARDPYANEDAMRDAENLQEPLIVRHLFHVHLHTFPGLDQASEKYWQKRIQPFFDEMAARNFSSSIERGEISNRRLYTLAATQYLGSFVSRGFGVRGEGETRGPGVGEPGTEKWGVGKNWGKGTVKRGLDRPERIDDDLMDQIDNLFDGESGRLWRAAGKEWSTVRRDWSAFKESIIESETGLEEAISYLDISNVKNLPPQYRNSVEFVRIQAAYVAHSLFVTAPNADDILKMVKGIHALAPYWGAKQLLKYANAETMISGILSLLLARPGGAKSLLQRIFSYVIGKEASYIQKEFVVPLRKEINDPELSKKVEDYVRRGDRVESRRIQRDAKKRGEDVLTTILLSAHGKLSREAEDHVLELQRCFALSPYRGNLNLAYPETTPAGADQPPMPSWGAKGSDNSRARKFALLKLLLRECLKRRDREQAVEIASGSLIPAIIKDSLATVFYPAIRSIAKNANLSERLGDLQKLIDDMLEVHKSGDRSIEGWIALAARHEQSLYMLFHECAPISKPLWDWCQLGLDYMALSTTDPAHPADRRAPNLEINLEELLQDARLSGSEVKKIIAEADKLARYSKWTKVRYELEARRNYLLGKPEAGHVGGVSEVDITDDNMRREFRNIDAMMEDLMADAGETLDDGKCEDGVRGTEKYDFPWAFFDEVDPLNQHLAGEEEVGPLRVPKFDVGYAPPSLKYIRRLQPLFCELLASKLPDWQSADTLAPLKSEARGGKGGISLKPRKIKMAQFRDPAGDRDGSSTYPSESKSVLSNSSSRFKGLKVPRLFGRK